MTKTKKTDKEPNIKTEPFTRDLLVPLTREEVEERSQQMAHLLFEREHKAEEFAEARKAHKGELKKMGLEVSRLRNEVRAKSCERTIACERRFLYDQRKVVEVRVDTGEVLGDRAMTIEELALELPFIDEPGKKGAGGGIDSEFGGDSSDDTEGE